MIRKILLTSGISFLLLTNIAGAASSEPLTALTVFEAANKARNRYSRTELMLNPTLEAAAQARAIDIVRTQHFAHSGPANEPFFSWINDANISFLEAGENLAKDFIDPQTIVNAWLSSPSHRTNLLDNRYTDTGVGIANGLIDGQLTTVVVQFFIKSTEVKNISPEPNISLPPLSAGTVLGVSQSAADRRLQLWLILSLLINVSIAFWLIDHWHWHRKVDHVFSK